MFCLYCNSNLPCDPVSALFKWLVSAFILGSYHDSLISVLALRLESVMWTCIICPSTYRFTSLFKCDLFCLFPVMQGKFTPEVEDRVDFCERKSFQEWEYSRYQLQLCCCFNIIRTVNIHIAFCTHVSKRKQCTSLTWKFITADEFHHHRCCRQHLQNIVHSNK